MCRQIFASETIGYHTIWTTLMGRLIDNTPPTSNFRSLWFSPNLVLNRGASRQVGRPPICPRCSAVCSNCCKCVTFGAGVAAVYYPTASANTSTFLRNHTPIIYLLCLGLDLATSVSLGHQITRTRRFCDIDLPPCTVNGNPSKLEFSLLARPDMFSVYNLAEPRIIPGVAIRNRTPLMFSEYYPISTASTPRIEWGHRIRCPLRLALPVRPDFPRRAVYPAPCRESGRSGVDVVRKLGFDEKMSRVLSILDIRSSNLAKS
ncbi:hypothetical protein FRC08_014181 [Ceratobasidium sp. 394]|nr:hypothetical protein FRC08_014181 [Ceratobasidium sp. 394]